MKLAPDLARILDLPAELPKDELARRLAARTRAREPRDQAVVELWVKYVRAIEKGLYRPGEVMDNAEALNLVSDYANGDLSESENELWQEQFLDAGFGAATMLAFLVGMLLADLSEAGWFRLMGGGYLAFPDPPVSPAQNRAQVLAIPETVEVDPELARVLDLPVAVSKQELGARFAELAGGRAPWDEVTAGMWVEFARSLEENLRGSAPMSLVDACDLVLRDLRWVRTGGLEPYWGLIFTRAEPPKSHEIRLGILLRRLVPQLADAGWFQLRSDT